MEDNSGEVELLSSMNASRGFGPNTHLSGAALDRLPPVATVSAQGDHGSVEPQSMGDHKFGLNNNRGRFRPNFAFSSNWSSSGSEGGHGRGSFFGRNTSMQRQ